jgi:hypothetical protein
MLGSQRDRAGFCHIYPNSALTEASGSPFSAWNYWVETLGLLVCISPSVCRPGQIAPGAGSAPRLVSLPGAEARLTRYLVTDHTSCCVRWRQVVTVDPVVRMTAKCGKSPCFFRIDSFIDQGTFLLSKCPLCYIKSYLVYTKTCGGSCTQERRFLTVSGFPIKSMPCVAFSP